MAIVVIRVLFRIVFGGVDGGHVLVDLPTIPLPDWVAGVPLLGPVTREALLAGLYDGLRLAAIVICVGAANSLANPKRLLKSVPPALYEIGTALVVAVTVFPQLADSARRVRAAQALRGDATGRVGRLRRFLVPVLEDALERSLALAAGMDARGYGRAGAASPAASAGRPAPCCWSALCGLCVGAYAVLDRTAPRVLALPMLAGRRASPRSSGWSAPAAGSSAPATGRTAGGCPSCVVAALRARRRRAPAGGSAATEPLVAYPRARRLPDRQRARRWSASCVGRPGRRCVAAASRRRREVAA